MTTTTKQAQQLSELQSSLWSIANVMRGKMDSNEFKDYILGLIFYRYLSENLVDYVNDILLKDDDIKYEEAWNKPEYNELLKTTMLNNYKLGYYIEPDYLFSNLIKMINTGKFDISVLSKAINLLSESTLGQESQEDFENLFDVMDLNSSNLGKGEGERTSLISEIMLKINDIDFCHGDSEIDILGDAYEFLIGKFAAAAGKSKGEFYTPQQVSVILAKLVTMGKDKIKSIYDPTCGSGSLLLRVGRECEVSHYYGQEAIYKTYNLARMNMLLHGISFKFFNIKNDDTLINPQHSDLKFEAIVANPPYSLNWSASPIYLEDERYRPYGKLAPKSKADFAFIQHMIHHLDDNGTMAVVLPHGILFRGAAEGAIRKYMIQNQNYLDAVIGLPPNIFFGTSIPTCILVFKKNRDNKNDILFIDASKDFEKGKNQNRLRDEDLNRIVETYEKRITSDKYSNVASIEEIEENDFNLNIPRYVDTFEEEVVVPLTKIGTDLLKIQEEINSNTSELIKMMDELVSTTPEFESELEEFKIMFKEGFGYE